MWYDSLHQTPMQKYWFEYHYFEVINVLLKQGTINSDLVCILLLQSELGMTTSSNTDYQFYSD